MGRTKITLLELGDRLQQGKTVKEIAAEFQVTPRAIQKKMKVLELAISKTATLHQAKVILAQQIDAQEQLNKINRSANRLLDRLEARLEQDQEALYARLEIMVLEFKPLLGPHGGEAEAFLEALRAAALPDQSPAVTDQIFKALAEIRKQLELLARVAADWLEAKRLAQVHQAMVEEIAVESPECRQRIIRRLGGLQSAGLLFPVDGFA